MPTQDPPKARSVRSDADESRIFKLDFPPGNTIARRFLSRAARSLERLFSLDQINQLYSRCAKSNNGLSFVNRLLQDLKIAYRISDADLARIPREGPMLVVANHPFGAIEGIILGAVLQSVRPDVKIMANYLLQRVPEMRDLFIYVDPFGKEGSIRENIRPLRESMRWLDKGGLLAMFPAGTVAHLNLRRREVTDPVWSPTVARLVRKAECPVLPFFFSGHNGPLFHLLGLIHPTLRTVMLPRELLNKRGHEIEIRVGNPIPYRKLAACADDHELTEYARQRTFMLQYRQPSSAAAPAASFKGNPVIGPVDRQLLAREAASLPAAQQLIVGDDLSVSYFRGNEAPNLLREIGRLREITYRATGEGTGTDIDLDRFDDWYTHLFVWSNANKEIVGAYRLGPTDDIIAAHGKKGLYTSTLFKYKTALLQKFGPALELGRSFIREEYQRSYAPLMLLWKGIGKFILAQPKYKVLFGPVSISNNYQSVSRQLLVQFLKAHHTPADLAPLAKAKKPFRITGIHGCDPAVMQRVLKGSDDVSDLVSEIEPDQKGMPVLLRQYLKLGARFFAFNIDPNFNDAIDALLVVDLTRTEQKVLTRYLGRPGAQALLEFHGIKLSE